MGCKGNPVWKRSLWRDTDACVCKMRAQNLKKSQRFANPHESYSSTHQRKSPLLMVSRSHLTVKHNGLMPTPHCLAPVGNSLMFTICQKCMVFCLILFEEPLLNWDCQISALPLSSALHQEHNCLDTTSEKQFWRCTGLFSEGSYMSFRCLRSTRRYFDSSP